MERHAGYLGIVFQRVKVGDVIMRKGADLSTLVFDSTVAENASILIAPRNSSISRDEAINTARKYAELLRTHLFNDARVFVFGSTISGNASINSDIDVAIVSENINDNLFDADFKLNELARAVSWDIEVHALAWEDWCKGDPHVLEVMKWGVEV